MVPWGSLRLSFRVIQSNWHEKTEHSTFFERYQCTCLTISFWIARELQSYYYYYQVTLKRKKSGFHVSLRRERLESATAVWKINESSAPFLLAPTWFIDNITFIFYSNIVVYNQKLDYCLTPIRRKEIWKKTPAYELTRTNCIWPFILIKNIAD